MQSVIHKVTVVLTGIGQVVGIRSSTEESRYSVAAKFGEIEIRRYDERLAAETEVAGASETARAVGFRHIAGYIFGGNAAKDSIAMTAPVAQDFQKKPQDSSQLIAMTAPVVQVKDSDRHWRIQFFMPAIYTRESLPVPNDPSVRNVAVPAQSYAVLRFSGDRSGKAVEVQEIRLVAALQPSRWRTSGTPVAWFYDPPWTIPALRRNEVAVPVMEAP